MVLRLVSFMIRSSGLLVLIFCQWMSGKIIGQSFVESLLDEGGVAALVGMNGLEHAAHLANPGRRDLAEDVAIEMHHAALVARFRITYRIFRTFGIAGFL